MRIEKTSTWYAICVSLKSILLVINEPINDDHATLLDRLIEVAGVREVNYDGMLGQAIYVELDADGDTPETHAKLIEITRAYVKELATVAAG